MMQVCRKPFFLVWTFFPLLAGLSFFLLFSASNFVTDPRHLTLKTVNKTTSWLSGYYPKEAEEKDESATESDTSMKEEPIPKNVSSSLLTLKNTSNALPPLQTLELAPMDRICLIHVGKAGGSTVMCAVGISDVKCRRNSPVWKHFSEFRNRSAIAAHVHDRLHASPSLHNCKGSPKAFLVLLRHPIERFYSWFYFAKPPSSERGSENRHYLWLDCYATMKDLVVGGLETIPSHTITAAVPNMTCPERAWATVLGARIINRYGHNWYNYEYYGDKIHSMAADKNLPVLVLRNEHMAVDWDRLDVMLGGAGKDGEALFATKVNAHAASNSSRSNYKTTSRAEAELGPDGIRYLCRALCLEIQHYKTLLHAAANLTPQQKSESLQELRDKCPVQADTDACPDVPQFALAPPNDEFVGAGKPRYKQSL